MAQRDGMSMDDRPLRRIEKNLTKAQGAHVRIGVLASRGGNADHDGITMIELAAIHEFGSPAAGVPERSFIRRTFEVKTAELKVIKRRLAERVVTGKMTIGDALEILGSWGAAEVKKTITVGPGVPPPNAPSTVERKGSARPLVDTGRLVGSIQWEVVGA